MVNDSQVVNTDLFNKVIGCNELDSVRIIKYESTYILKIMMVHGQSQNRACGKISSAIVGKVGLKPSKMLKILTNIAAQF